MSEKSHIPGVPNFVLYGLAVMIALAVLLTLTVNTEPVPEGGQPAAIAESMNE